MNWSDFPVKKLLFLIGIIVTGCCLLLPGLLLWYPGYRWPAPGVYPQVTASLSEGAIGSWGLARDQTYIVNRSLDDTQQYYEAEMQRYCIDSWHFETLTGSHWTSSNSWGLRELPEYVENSVCRQAQCKVRRWRLDQEFKVLLCAENKMRTKVVQVDLWED